VRWLPKWMRRRWGTEFVIRNPRREVVDRYVSPARYWTKGGAEVAAGIESIEYQREPLLADLVTITPVKVGPYDRDRYEADLDAELEALTRKDDRP